MQAEDKGEEEEEVVGGKVETVTAVDQARPEPSFPSNQPSDTRDVCPVFGKDWKGRQDTVKTPRGSRCKLPGRVSVGFFGTRSSVTAGYVLLTARHVRYPRPCIGDGNTGRGRFVKRCRTED